MLLFLIFYIEITIMKITRITAIKSLVGTLFLIRDFAFFDVQVHTYTNECASK